MRKTIFFLFLLLLSVSAMAQKHCISGYVMDAASRETLIGATEDSIREYYERMEIWEALHGGMCKWESNK